MYKYDAYKITQDSWSIWLLFLSPQFFQDSVKWETESWGCTEANGHIIRGNKTILKVYTYPFTSVINSEDI